MAAWAAIGRGLIKYGPKVIQAAKMIGGAFSKTADAVKGLTSRFMEFNHEWIEIQDTAFKVGRTMAMSRDQLKAYNESLISATRDLGLAYGKTYKELADFQEQYSYATGRNIKLTKDQLAYMSAMSNLVDPQLATQLVEEFDKVGVGIGQTLANTELVQERAKALGLNAKKASEGLKENIKLASKYSFKNGVDDIQKMVLKSQHLRMNMSDITKSMENFMDIEGAIKTTANLQVLGGSFGAAFSNPMQAMYEAEADPAAFQERLVSMLDGKGKYDEKTGAVTFDPVTMRTIRAAADALKIDVDALTNPAMAKVQDREVEKELNRNAAVAKFSDEDKEAIMALARTNVDEKTGKHQVSYFDVGEGKVVSKNVEDLTKEQLEIAKDNLLGEEQLWGDVHDIRALMDAGMKRAQDSKSFQDDVNGVKSWYGGLWAGIENFWMKPISGILNGITGLFGNGTTKKAQGGIIQPDARVAHAQFGAVIPGDSYSGDKVPALLNSGEMVLNQGEQKGMFDLFKNVADIGVNAFLMNKAGNAFGVKGLGKTALMANLMSGGDAGLMDIAEMHMMRGMLGGKGGGMLSMLGGGLIPSLPILGGGKNADGEEGVAPTDYFSDFNAELKNFKKEWKSTFKDIGKDVKGGLNNVKKSVGNTFKGWKNTIESTKLGGKAFSAGRSIGNNAQRFGNWVGGRYNAAANWAGNKYNAVADWSRDRYDDAADYFGRKKSRLKNSKVGRAVSRGKGYAKTLGRSTGRLFKALPGVGKVAKAAGAMTNVAKATGTASKALSAVGKSSGALKTIASVGGRSLGKAIPVVGTALSVGMAIGDIASAKSNYDAKVKEIESSNMSDEEKADAKDKAVKEKNSSIGSGIGTGVGAVAGGALGSVFGPVGTMIGAAAGGWLGGKVGGFFGGLFGGNNKKKLQKEKEKKEKEQKEKEEREIKLKEGNNKEIIDILKDIRRAISGGGILSKGKATASSVFEAVKGKAKSFGKLAMLGPLGAPALGFTLGKKLFGKFFGGGDNEEGGEEPSLFKKIMGGAGKMAMLGPLGAPALGFTLGKKLFGKFFGGEEGEEGASFLDGLKDKAKSVATMAALGPVGLLGKKLFGKDETEEGGEELSFLDKAKSAATMAALGPVGFLGKKLFGKDAVEEGGENGEGTSFLDKIKNGAKSATTMAALGPVGFLGKLLFGKDVENTDNKVAEGAVAKAKVDAENKEGAKPVVNQKTGEVLMASDDKLTAEVKPKEESTFSSVAPVNDANQTNATPSKLSLDGNNINLNVSGTIKLDGGGQSANIDLEKLINTPEFKRQLVDMIQRTMNESANGGRYNSESAVNNGNSIWNRTGS